MYDLMLRFTTNFFIEIQKSTNKIFSLTLLYGVTITNGYITYMCTHIHKYLKIAYTVHYVI